MKKTIITILLFATSISVIIAQDIDVISQEKDTITTQSVVLNVEKKDSIIQDQTISQKDIIELREGLKLLLTAEFAGFDQVVEDHRRTTIGRYTQGLRVYIPFHFNSKLYTSDIRLDFGYYITNRLFLSFIFDNSIGLLQHSYNNEPTLLGGLNIALGGELGYDILRTKQGNLDIRAAVASTIFGESNYQFTSYDAGVYWNIGFKRDIMKMIVGIGVKYYDHRIRPFNDSWSIFYTIGFKIH